MATIQLQHYVPQFMLRRFGSSKKDRLHVFDKHTDEWVPWLLSQWTYQL